MMRESKPQKFDSDDPDVLAAYQAETNGEYLLAIDFYKKALEKNPELGIVYKHAGNVYYRIGMLDNAVEYLRKAVDKLPNYPTALYELGLAYYRQVKIREGIECLKKVLEIDSGFLMAHYWLGIMNYHYGHLKDAKFHYQTVTERNPNFHLGVTNLRLGYYDEAIKDLNEVTKKNPDSPAAYALLGDAYLNIDHKFEARKAYQKALELDPEDRKAMRGLVLLDDFNEIIF